MPRVRQELRAQDALAHRIPVVLYGPELYGKSWLLHPILEYAKEKGFHLARLNLKLFGMQAFDSLDTFLHNLAFHLFTELNLDRAPVEDAFAAARMRGGPIHALNTLIRQATDTVPGRGLLLAVDNVDQVALTGQSYQEEFFSLLRAWADAEDGFLARLSMILCISTAPALLIREHHRSPFNIGDPIYLPDFDDEQVLDLARRYELQPTSREMARLRKRVNGHPYLVRVALYEARCTRQTLAELLDREEADPMTGIFGRYLEHLRNQMNRRKDMRDALCQLVRNPAAVVDDELRSRLERGGLIINSRDKNTGKWHSRLRLDLYQHIVP